MASKNKSKKNKQSKPKVEEIKAVDQKKTVVSEEKPKDKGTKGKATPKNAKSKEEPNFFQKSKTFFKGVISELKKVNWLTTEELMKNTSVVAGIVVIFTALTWIMDTGLGAMVAVIIGSK